MKWLLIITTAILSNNTYALYCNGRIIEKGAPVHEVTQLCSYDVNGIKTKNMAYRPYSNFMADQAYLYVYSGDNNTNVIEFIDGAVYSIDGGR